MKQPTRTLPQAVKLFPKSWSETSTNNIPDNFYHLPYEEKIKNVGAYTLIYYCSNKDGKVFFGQKCTVIKRCGRKFYPEVSWTNTIVIDGTKISTHKITIPGLCKFASIIGIDLKFIHNIPTNLKNYLIKSCIIADILRKKVYNQETLCRCILSKIYRLKGFDWKLFYNFHNTQYYDISISDLQAFTKDLAKSMRVLIDQVTCTNLYNDLLRCAVQLNEVVDFTWSQRRLQEEHQRQINELNRREIETKEQVPVFNIVCTEPNIRLLNTEKEVFLEGTTMHHCLYTNYWNRIKNKEYIAFHMIAPENCTFSFKKINNEIVFDQAYCAYDKPVSNETKQIIRDFLERTKKCLFAHLVNTGVNNPYYF